MAVSIQIIAGFLLIARLVSVIFIGIILKLQWGLFKREIDFRLVPNLTKYERRKVYLARKVLFALAVIIFCGNFIPIIIDTITLLGNDLSRPANLKAISVLYAGSNALTAMFSAIFIWALYKVAGLTTSDQD